MQKSPTRNLQFGRIFKLLCSSIISLILIAAVPAAQAQLVLEEIVVTAKKREQNLQDVTATVNVVSGQTLQDYNIHEFTDLERLTSGLQLNQRNSRTATIAIRGLTFDPESGASPTVVVYQNELRLRSDDAFNAMFDLARVEVVRGPQGSLQGATSPGGAILIKTAAPDLNEVTGYVRGTYGHTNEAVNIQGAIGVPLIKDKLGLRVAAYFDENDGNNIFNRTTQNIQDQDTDAYRATLRWAPSDTFETSLSYQKSNKFVLDSEALEGSRSTADAFGGVPGIPCAFVPGGTNTTGCTSLRASERTALSATDPFTDKETELTTLNASWEFGNHTLDFVYGNASSTKTGRVENDASLNLPLQNAFYQLGIGVNGDTDYQTHQGTTTTADRDSFEIRISSNDNDVWNYIFGFYSDDQKTSTDFEAFSTAARYIPLASLNYTRGFFPNGVVPIPGNPFLPPYLLTFTGGHIEGINFSTGGTIPVNSDNTAFFTSHSFQVSDKLRLEAALRYQEIEGFRTTPIKFTGYHQPETISIQNVSAVSSNPAIPGFIVGATANGVAAGTLAGTLASIAATDIEGIAPEFQNPEDDVVTGTLGMRYEWSDTTSTYFSYNRSYRAGGISIVPGVPLTARDILYDAEDGDAYEFGIKSSLLDGRAELNTSLFYQTFDGFLGRITELQADADANPATTGDIAEFPGGLVFNGDATFSGIELDGRFLIQENWTLNGSANYTKAEWNNAQAPCNVRAAGEQVGRCSLNGRIAGSPEFSFSLQTEYVSDFGGLEGFIRGNVKYNGGIVSSQAQRMGQPAAETNSYMLVDVYAGIRQENWEFAVWAKNLLDEDEKTDLFHPGDNYDVNGHFSQVRQLPERTVGVTASYNF